MATTEALSKPLRADARRNRARVLEAARECFAADGINAQIDDIAAAAKVGVGTVYRHFETKEALIGGLAAEHFRGEAEVAREALEIEDPWEAFTTLIRNGAEVMAHNRALAQVSAERPEVMRDAAINADVEYGFFGLLETLIVRAKDAGALRQDFELEDIPAIMCSLGSLQVSANAYANSHRLLEIVIDGLRAPGLNELPPVVTRIPRAERA